MPERTLVIKISIRTMRYGMAFCVALLLHAGCSQMKPPSLRELVDHQPRPTQWEVEKQENLERMFEENPEAFEPLTAEAAVAARRAEIAMEPETTALSYEQTQTNETPRLTAVPMAENQESVECQTGQCSHPGCNSRSAKPKLPYAEPIDFSTVAKTPPPAAVVSQPLSPIGAESRTRTVSAKLNSAPMSPTGDHSSPEGRHSNRRNPNRHLYQQEAPSNELVAADDSTESNVIRLESPEKLPSDTGTGFERKIIENATASGGIALGGEALSTASDPDDVENLPVDNAGEFSIKANKQSLQSERRQSQMRPPGEENATDAPRIIVDPSQFPSQKAEIESIPPFADCPPPDDDLQAREIKTEKENRISSSNEFTRPYEFVPDKGAAPLKALTELGQNFDSGASDFSKEHHRTASPSVVAKNDSGSAERFEDLTDEQFEDLFGVKLAANDGESGCKICGSLDCSTCTAGSAGDEGNEFRPSTISVAAGERAESENSISASSQIVMATHLESHSDFDPAGSFGPSSGFEPAKDLNSNPTSWQAQIEQSIKVVEQQLVNETSPELKNAHQVNLRLLEVLKRNIQLVSSESPPPIDREAWQVRLNAIAAMLQNPELSSGDGQRLPDEAVAEGLVCLRRAVEQLEAIAGLRLGNASFCTEVKGFGQVTCFATNDFHASEKVLVYCEVENYRSTEIETVGAIKYLTRLQGSFAISTEQGRVVQQGRFPVVEDTSLSKREDFYMYFPIAFANLPTGQYRLDLQVEDLTTRSAAAVEPSLSFTVQ